MVILSVLSVDVHKLKKIFGTTNWRQGARFSTGTLPVRLAIELLGLRFRKAQALKKPQRNSMASICPGVLTAPRCVPAVP